MSDPHANPIDYEKVLPVILEKLFPLKEERKQAIDILADYGTRSFHQEIPRVRTAILRAASVDTATLRQYTETACCDFRDILSIAEYPNQSKHWGLSKRDPAKYQRLVEKDRQQHLDWIEAMTS